MLTELERVQRLGLSRSLTAFSDISATHVTVDGERLLLCASNNYLGLAHDERVIAAGIAAIKEYGSGATGSRLTTGNTRLHQMFEAELAVFKGTQSALLFSSGYLANLAVLSTLVNAQDAIFSDALNHASIIDGCRLSKAAVFVYRHKDMAHLEQLLQDAPKSRRRIIVTDGVFSMDGDVAPLSAIVGLARQHDALVVVDDAHGVGVLGNKGAGTAEFLGVQPEDIDVHMGTLSKALGSEGAYVAGSTALIHYLLNRARPFIFNTALAPSAVGAARESLRIIQQEPERRTALQRHSKELRARLAGLGLKVAEGITPIIPILIGGSDESVRTSRALRTAGVFAPAIRPPTVPLKSARIRVALNACHTQDHLEQIVQAFAVAATQQSLNSFRSTERG